MRGVWSFVPLLRRANGFNVHERVGVFWVVDVAQPHNRLSSFQNRGVERFVLSHEVCAKPSSQCLGQGTEMLHGKLVVPLGQVLNVLVRVDVDLEDKLQELNELAVLWFGCDACIKARC